MVVKNKLEVFISFVFPHKEAMNDSESSVKELFLP
jgi:hypothetical protein